MGRGARGRVEPRARHRGQRRHAARGPAAAAPAALGGQPGERGLRRECVGSARGTGPDRGTPHIPSEEGGVGGGKQGTRPRQEEKTEPTGLNWTTRLPPVPGPGERADGLGFPSRDGWRFRAPATGFVGGEQVPAVSRTRGEYEHKQRRQRRPQGPEHPELSPSRRTGRDAAPGACWAALALSRDLLAVPWWPTPPGIHGAGARPWGHPPGEGCVLVRGGGARGAVLPRRIQSAAVIVLVRECVSGVLDAGRQDALRSSEAPGSCSACCL